MTTTKRKKNEKIRSVHYIGIQLAVSRRTFSACRPEERFAGGLLDVTVIVVPVARTR